MPVKRLTERARSKSLGISLTCKRVLRRVLRRLLIGIRMPKNTKPKEIGQESSLTFVDWLLAIDLDPLKTGSRNRDE